MLSSVIVLAVVAAACGGSSPSSPSGSGSVGIQGVVLPGGSASVGLGASAGSKVATSAGQVTVTIEGTGISTSVSANGTFELEGVPAGTFTLIFQKDGLEIGRVVITASDGAEVKIVVQIQVSGVIVVDIKIEGQNGTDSGGTTTATCLISGGKVGSGIELEGDVSSGAYAAFEMAVNGERSSGLVDVKASSASFKCNGSKADDAECKASVKSGAKVHVRGTLMTCTTTAAQVTATEVMVQKGAD
jgi:hypothetical protein